MRVLVRTSTLAIWSRRLGSFALAVIGLSFLLHLFDQLDTETFVLSLMIGTGIAALGFLLALAAYVRLWFTGDKGWGLASTGLVTALLAVLPAGYAAAMAARYPSTVDVTTAINNPPALLSAAPGPVAALDPETVLDSFPNLITRSYQVDPGALYALAEGLVRQRGWEITRARPALAAGAPATLNVMRRTLLGWRSEMALRIMPSSLGAQIDLRSASLRPLLHDQGENGRAIETFLLALDHAVTAYVQGTLATGDEELHEVIVEDDVLDE